MTHKIIIAGAGGQGIMILGKILAEAAMRESRHTTWLPSYGAEVRGGAAYCMVTISDEEIGTPFINKADTLIVMNNPSLERFKRRITDRGLIIANSSLTKKDSFCPENKKEDSRNPVFLSYPFTDIALGLGNIKTANIVALGYFIAKKKIIRKNTVLGIIRDFAAQSRKELAAINKKALVTGLRLVEERKEYGAR